MIDVKANPGNYDTSAVNMTKEIKTKLEMAELKNKPEVEVQPRGRSAKKAERA